MIQINTKKIIIISLLSSVLICFGFTPTYAMESSKKENYVFNLEDFNHITYEYTINGDKYFVEETMNNSSSSTMVTYKFEGNEKIEIDKKTFYFNYTEDGVVVSKIAAFVLPKKEENESRLATSDIYNGQIYYDYIYNKYYTGWFYSETVYSSNQIVGLSLQAVCIIIGAVGSIAAPVTSTIITGIASLAISAGYEVLYFKRDVDECWEITYPGREFIGWAVGIRSTVYTYGDKYRTVLLGEYTSEYHDPEYWPDHMGF